MKALNFHNVKKEYWTVTLPDEKETVIMIGTPTKALLSEITSLQSALTTLTENHGDINAIDEIYGICAKIMSRNKGGITITREYLESIFDFQDIMLFFNGYMEFIGEAMSRKN